MTEDEFIKMLEGHGYRNVRRLPTGEWAGNMRFMFTVAIVTGLDDVGYRCRWCYGSMNEAHAALILWDGQGNPPGRWLKQKGSLPDGTHVDRTPEEAAVEDK